jgi:N-methylhydantoinase B
MLVYKTVTRPWAINGGVTGENNHTILNPGTDHEAIGGGFYRPMGAGEVLVNNSGGGGGWGNPFLRDPQRVLTDVRDGYVSLDAAARDYGVVINATAWEVDEGATAVRRAGPRPDEPGPVGGTAGPRPAVVGQR